VSGLLSIFKQAPNKVEIEDSDEVKKLYSYWRIRILYSMFIGYAFYYFTRKSFNAACPGMVLDLGYDKSQIGVLISILFSTYGVSKFASGILSDKCSPRYFMAFGLIMTGILNISFGLSSSFFLFALFWGLNGWFQGFGWPACTRFLTQWYSQSERGSWWSTCSVSHNVGAALIPWIVGFSLDYLGWRYAMYIPGVICIIGGVYLINRLRDTPQSLGLPPVEKFRNDVAVVPLKKNIKVRTILIEYVFKNKYMWMLGFAYFFVYVVRTGIDTWTILYMIEKKGYNQLAANGNIFLFEVGGFIGSLCAGWSSDYLFSAKRGPVNVIFALGMLLSLVGFWYLPQGYQLLDSIALFFVGFSIFGPQLLIGMAATELSPKEAAATSNGFVGCFASMGAVVSGYPLGKIAQELGWEGYFLAMILCCVISILLLLPLWNVKDAKKRKSLAPEFTHKESVPEPEMA
jgi:MFS transporter, OPA family, sugar phosphate sensor protein UhpC